MKKIKSGYFIVTLLLSLLLALGVFAAKKENDEGRPSKYLILIMDTSSSMARPSGNIFGDVKSALKSLISQLKIKDVVQLFTFDKTVNIFPAVEIKSDESKNVVMTLIDGFQARGEATFTSLMLKKLFEESPRINSSYPNHYVSAIVLSDGYDYPPKGRKSISIKDYVLKNKTSGMKEWFVYYIALGVLDKKIGRDIKKLAPNTKLKKVVDAKEIPGEISKADAELNKEIREAEAARPKIWHHPIFYALILIIAGGFMIFFVWRKNKLVLNGTLAFWKNDEKDAAVEVVDLTALKKGNFSVGREKRLDLYLSDFQSNIPFYLKAQFRNTLVVSVMVWKARNKRIFKHHTQAKRDRLSDGDIFTYGKYSFRYNED